MWSCCDTAIRRWPVMPEAELGRSPKDAIDAVNLPTLWSRVEVPMPEDVKQPSCTVDPRHDGRIMPQIPIVKVLQ
jgi:hypothetical protein